MTDHVAGLSGTLKLAIEEGTRHYALNYDLP